MTAGFLLVCSTPEFQPNADSDSIIAHFRTTFPFVMQRSKTRHETTQRNAPFRSEGRIPSPRIPKRFRSDHANHCANAAFNPLHALVYNSSIFA